MCTGASATVLATRAAGAADAGSLRAQVDAVGTRYFAAQARAHTLDDEVRALDRRLSQTQHRVAVLHPMAKAQAVQLYQAGTAGFTALFDTATAMESARRAELIGRANDHTQALLDEYAQSSDTLHRERRQIAHERAAQAKVVAALAAERASLERALAQAQQAYLDQLAAEAHARAVANAESATTSPGRTAAPTTPTTRAPSAPPAAPIRVAPPEPPQSGLNPHHDDPFLVCTRTRESSGDYTAVNPGGYYGAYQFSQPTWDLTASHAGSPQDIGVRPDRASAWDQDQLAWTLHQWQGNAPWGGLC